MPAPARPSSYDADATAQEPAGQPHRPVRARRPVRRLPASRAARSSSTPTAAWPVTAAARSAARTPPRSTAPPPTRRATWPRTRRRRPRRPLRGPGRVRHRRRAPGVGDGRDLRHRESTAQKLAALVDEHFDLRPGAFLERSTCAGRSTRRPRPTATSAARTRTSPGSAPTRPTRCARPRGSAKRPRSRPQARPPSAAPTASAACLSSEARPGMRRTCSRLAGPWMLSIAWSVCSRPSTAAPTALRPARAPRDRTPRPRRARDRPRGRARPGSSGCDR